jgi:DNA-binding transcriptional LysR family regulator
VYGPKSYLRRTGKQRPLREHDWIALDDSMSHQVSLAWLARLLPVELAKLRTSTYAGVRQACIDGLGLAVLPCFLGDAHRALVRVGGKLGDCKNELWLLTHPDLRKTARVKAVFDLMREELGKLATSFSGDAAGP